MIEGRVHGHRAGHDQRAQQDHDHGPEERDANAELVEVRQLAR